MASLGQAIEFHEGKPQVEMTSDLPLYLRFGARYRWLTGPPDDRRQLADVEMDVQWERWSAIRSMDTFVNADLIGRPIEPFRLPHFYRDTVSIRLGGSVTIPRSLLGGDLTLSGGLFYDSSASPLEYTRLNYQAFALMGFGVGASYRIRGVELHLAVSRTWGGWGPPWDFQSKRRVERSCVEPVDPFHAPSMERCDPYADTYDEQRDISRGVFELTYTIVSLGFQVSFEELALGSPVKR
jgi:hypothetical protein